MMVMDNFFNKKSITDIVSAYHNTDIRAPRTRFVSAHHDMDISVPRTRFVSAHRDQVRFPCNTSHDDMQDKCSSGHGHQNPTYTVRFRSP